MNHNVEVCWGNYYLILQSTTQLFKDGTWDQWNLYNTCDMTKYLLVLLR